MSDVPVGQFFDALSEDYTATIERCFPRYREMLWALLEYLPSDRTYSKILELGCGTGNLSVLLAERFTDSSIWFVDVSRESLDVCRANHAFDEHDFRDMAFDPGTFDLIISSISIHHLLPEEKQSLFADAHVWLQPSGIFTFADQFAGATDDLYSTHMLNWQRQSLAAGSTEDEWAMWMRHQLDHDHHDTLADQMNWLSDAGFSIVDVPWRYLLWTVLQSRK